MTQPEYFEMKEHLQWDYSKEIVDFNSCSKRLLNIFTRHKLDILSNREDKTQQSVKTSLKNFRMKSEVNHNATPKRTLLDPKKSENNSNLERQNEAEKR